MSGTRNPLGMVMDILLSNPSVKLSTGWVDQNGIIRNDYILVHSAPPAILKAVVSQLVMVDLIEDGLLIPIER